MTHEDLPISWKPELVVISYLMAVQASYTTVLILQMRLSHGMRVLAALCLSVAGIWAMHFTGMAAMEINVDVEYDIGWTIGSALFAFAFTFAAFTLVEYKIGVKSSTVQDIGVRAHIRAIVDAPHPWILLSGLLIALGVCIMHYTGMHAMQSVAHRRMHWEVVAASVLIALFAATAALYFAFVLPLTRRYTIPTAFVMGVAVCGMHYTGMYGMKFEVEADKKLPHSGQSSIRDIVVYIVFVAGAMNVTLSAFSSFVYRLSLRRAAARAHGICDAILAAQFEALQEVSVDDEQDPEMRSLTQAFVLMGKQLQMLRCYLPQSLLAQFDAKWSQEEEEIEGEGGEGDGREQVPNPILPESVGSPVAMGTPPLPDFSSESAASSRRPSFAPDEHAPDSSMNGMAVVPFASSDNLATNKSALSSLSSSMNASFTSSAPLPTKAKSFAGFLSLGVVKRTVTVMTVNIRHFHDVVKGMDPAKVAEWYALKLDTIMGVVGSHNGVLSHFHGDHVFISFNASRPNAMHTRQAGKAALQIAEKMDVMGTATTIGIATGPALVGNVGGTFTKAYSIIGPVFPQSVVLERMCKMHRRVGNLCSQASFSEMGLDLHVRVVDVVRLPGEANRRTVHTVLGVAERAAEEWMYELQQDKEGPNVAINRLYQTVCDGKLDGAKELMRQMQADPKSRVDVDETEWEHLERLSTDPDEAIHAQLGKYYDTCVLQH